MFDFIERVIEEARRTAAGSPSASHVARFKEEATAGGQKALGLTRDGPSAPVERTPSVGPGYEAALAQIPRNVIDLNVPYQAQNAPLPPPDQMMPLPVPRPTMELAGLQPKSGGDGGGSQLRAQAPRAAAEQQGQETLAGTKAATDPDSRLFGLGQKQQGLERERGDALEKALHAKDYSDNEKVAVALIGLLAPLIGGLAGGAIAGPAGGAAGVAGGLGGAAQGVQSVHAEKSKNQEQAQALAAQLAGRSDRVDSEIAQRQGQLEQQVETGKTRDQARELAVMRETGDTKRAREANATHIRTANIAAQNAIRNAEAKAKAAEESGAVKEYQGKASSFASAMLVSEHVLRSAEAPAFINSFRSWGTLRNALSAGDAKTQVYARAVENFLDAVARDESGAAIGEKEYDHYFNIYFPRNTSRKEDLDYAQKIRGVRLKNMLGKAGPVGARIAYDAYTSEFGEGAPSQQAAVPSYKVKWDQ